MPEVTLTGFRCGRCDWQWYPRLGGPPKVCPNCKRTDWNESPTARGENGASGTGEPPALPSQDVI